MKLRFLTALLCAGAAPCINALTITDLADDSFAHDTNPGDGICLDGLGACTLRAALEEANANAGLDIIDFSIAGTIALDAAEGPLPSIGDPISLTAYSAPGGNSDPDAPLASNPPVVQIDGSTLTARGGTVSNGLTLLGGATGSEILGLSITGFSDSGVSIFADDVLIQGCSLGLNLSQSSAPNLVGVTVFSDNVVIGREVNGTLVTGRGNAISGNAVVGLDLRGDFARVNGNVIGMDATASVVRGNTNGITIDGSDNWIGQTTDADQPVGNIITGNLARAISIRTLTPVPARNWIRANYIGVIDDLTAFGAGQEGVRLYGSEPRMGGGVNGFNFIANNTLGVEIAAGTVDAVVESNRIGLANPQVFNSDDGIRDFGDGSLITGNEIINSLGVGLRLSGSNAMVIRNKIGVIIEGNGVQNHGSLDAGIRVTGTGNTIGINGGANFIGFNGDGGIRVDSSADDTQIAFNQIGMNQDGYAMPNLLRGILFDGADDGLVSNNLIATNGGAGVRVVTGSERVDISSNQMFDNVGLGIDLGNLGVDSNDVGDGDSGPNQLQNSPAVSSVMLDDAGSPPQLLVEYAVDSDAGNSTYPLEIEFYFADSVASAEGREIIGSQTYTTPGAGESAQFDLSPLVRGGILVSVARDADGNTSEFSAAMPFGLPDDLYADSLESP